MACGRVTPEADSDTAEQQSLNIRAAGTVWVEKSCAAVCV